MKNGNYLVVIFKEKSGKYIVSFSTVVSEEKPVGLNLKDRVDIAVK